VAHSRCQEPFSSSAFVGPFFLDDRLLFLDDGLLFLDDGLLFLEDGLLFLEDGLLLLEDGLLFLDDGLLFLARMGFSSSTIEPLFLGPDHRFAL